VKITEADFKLFQEEFLKWVERYGCTGWEIHFDWEETSDTVDAYISPDCTGQTVTVTLGTDVSRPSEVGIKFLAFHEATELFLTKLRHQAMAREFSLGAFQSEIHQIINILKKLVFDNVPRI